MKYERNIKKWGDFSHVVVLPPDLVKFLELKENDEIIIQDDEGKHGKFISVWKK